MKNYKVVLVSTSTETFNVKADSIEEAENLCLRGEYDTRGEFDDKSYEVESSQLIEGS